MTASPIRAAPRCITSSRTARRQRPKVDRSPRASVSVACPDHRWAEGRQSYLIPTKKRCRSSSTCWSMRASASRLVRIQHRRRNPPCEDLGPGKTIVTILADYGTAAINPSLFNPDFLRSKKLPVPDWLERKSNISRRSRRCERPMATECLFRDDSYSRIVRRALSPSPTRAVSSSTARFLRNPQAAAW